MFCRVVELDTKEPKIPLHGNKQRDRAVQEYVHVWERSIHYHCSSYVLLLFRFSFSLLTVVFDRVLYLCFGNYWNVQEAT